MELARESADDERARKQPAAATTVPRTPPMVRRRIESPGRLQPKLVVGAAGDAYEREADAVAASVVQQLRSSTATDGAEDPVGRIRRASAAPAPVVAAAPGPRIRQPLPDHARSQMEGAFGVDLGGVAVHTGPTATELNDRIGARAFTTGQQIYFRDGLPDTATSSGAELLAHELTHVVQQTRPAVNRQLAGPIRRTASSGPVRVARTTVVPRAVRDVVPGASKIRRMAVGTIQRQIADDPTRIQLTEDVLKLLPSGFPGGQARVALKAIETRASAGQFDAEDLLNVHGRLTTEWTNRGVGIKNQFKQGKRAELETAFQNLLTQLQTWANTMPALFGPQVSAPLKTEMGKEEVEIRPGPGKRRVVIPTAKQARAAIVPITGIRFSQFTARGTTGGGDPLSSVMKHMATTGWRGDPVELVTMDTTYTKLPLPPQSRGVCSIDNRRLVAAIAAGLTDLPAVTHAPTEAMDTTWAAESQNASRYPIWRKDDGEIKIDVKRNFHLTADNTWTLEFAKDSHPVTYGDLIVIRTVNQGDMKILPGMFPLGGTERVPEVTGNVV